MYISSLYTSQECSLPKIYSILRTLLLVFCVTTEVESVDLIGFEVKSSPRRDEQNGDDDDDDEEYFPSIDELLGPVEPRSGDSQGGHASYRFLANGHLSNCV